MATLVLGLAGQALGQALLPQGLTFLGQTITGAALGGAIGAYAGAQIDAALAGRLAVEGPRLESLRVQGSTPGAPVRRVFGAARIAGEVIWASRFKETQSTRGGGKNAPRVTGYSYSASFAIGLCEGVAGGIGRIWADGKPLTLQNVIWRFHPGTEDQAPDPLIAAIEPDAPAYRGLAYVVFEDLPLAPFGNRLPQLSFEVFRKADENAAALERNLRAVCLIPGSGEFAYATTRVTRDRGRGRSAPENQNNASGETDITAALNQLQAQLPETDAVALVTAWFGDDLRAGHCRIKPGVEDRDKRTHPLHWRAGDVGRDSAHLVSRDGTRVNYGGTPSDNAVREAIASLKARGMAVTFYPFVFMDIPPGNAKPDPYGGAEQARFPWRGRITCFPAPGRAGSPDKSAGAAAEVAAFFGTAQVSDFSISDGAVIYSGDAEDWGLRRMILHYAHLCAAAGGVEAFLIGTELRGLTTLRDGPSSYPAVTALKQLAGDVRAVLGPEVKITYAADWTEYAGHDAADGTGDFHFHLDPLWADPAVNMIGIDYYAPLSDWREGVLHADFALSASGAIHDRTYLQSRVEAGERYDYFYASPEARAAGTRTPITDGAYGKPWVFRVKDLREWWRNAHFNRPGGVEAAAPTAWTPEAKPFWLTEAGCPAVDKGANEPNVFFDPKSAESALPHFSTGARDDLIQRRYLEALIGYWSEPARNPVSGVTGARMIDTGRIFAWCWDSRPFPEFPLRSAVWSDGPQWHVGHWLSGRVGASDLGAVVREICARAGVTQIDVQDLRGAVAGLALDRVMSAREALEPLSLVHAFDAAESGGVIRFRHRGAAASATLEAAALAERDASAAPRFARAETELLPGAVKASYIDALADYRVNQTEMRPNVSRTAKQAELRLPLSLTEAEARRVAARVLMEGEAGRDTVRFDLPPERVALEPGDAVLVHGARGLKRYRIERIAELGRREVFASGEAAVMSDTPPALDGVLPDPPPAFGPAELIALDLEGAAFDGADGLRAAVFAEPWPGRVEILRDHAGRVESIAQVLAPAVTGVTLTDLPEGPVHVWQRGPALDVRLNGGALSSASVAEVLAGANRAAIETAPGRFEIIQFAQAELIGPETWRLSQLLRGQFGTEPWRGAASGARFVLLDRNMPLIAQGAAWRGIDTALLWGPAALPADDPAWVRRTVTYGGDALRLRAPAHVKARRRDAGAIALSWIRRSRSANAMWDATEPPLDDGAEAYRVEIFDGTALKRRIETTAPEALYTSSQQTEDWGGPAPSPLAVQVMQIGADTGAGHAAAGLLTF